MRRLGTDLASDLLRLLEVEAKIRFKAAQVYPRHTRSLCLEKDLLTRRSANLPRADAAHPCSPARQHCDRKDAVPVTRIISMRCS